MAQSIARILTTRILISMARARADDKTHPVHSRHTGGAGASGLSIFLMRVNYFEQDRSRPKGRERRHHFVGPTWNNKPAALLEPAVGLLGDRLGGAREK